MLYFVSRKGCKKRLDTKEEEEEEEERHGKEKDKEMEKKKKKNIQKGAEFGISCEKCLITKELHFKITKFCLCIQ